MNRNISSQSLIYNDSMMSNGEGGSNNLIETFREMIASNIGRYIVCEFLIGTETLIRREGTIYDVGTNYVALYREEEDLYQVCDLYSLKFMYFSGSGRPDVSSIDNNCAGCSGNGNGRYTAGGNTGSNTGNSMGYHPMRNPSSQNNSMNMYR